MLCAGGEDKELQGQQIKVRYNKVISICYKYITGPLSADFPDVKFIARFLH